jgi:hypothetical protein
MNDRIRKTILHLQRNRMAGYYMKSREELLSLLSTLLTKGDRVGCGDSVTLEQTGVFDFLRRGEYLFWIECS